MVLQQNQYYLWQGGIRRAICIWPFPKERRPTEGQVELWPLTSGVHPIMAVGHLFQTYLPDNKSLTQFCGHWVERGTRNGAIWDPLTLLTPLYPPKILFFLQQVLCHNDLWRAECGDYKQWSVDLCDTGFLVDTCILPQLVLFTSWHNGTSRLGQCPRTSPFDFTPFQNSLFFRILSLSLSHKH